MDIYYEPILVGQDTYLSPKAPVPAREYGPNAFFLANTRKQTLWPGETAFIRVGFMLQLPVDCVAWLAPLPSRHPLSRNGVRAFAEPLPLCVHEPVVCVGHLGSPGQAAQVEIHRGNALCLLIIMPVRCHEGYHWVRRGLGSMMDLAREVS